VALLELRNLDDQRLTAPATDRLRLLKGYLASGLDPRPLRTLSHGQEIAHGRSTNKLYDGPSSASRVEVGAALLWIVRWATTACLGG
jgi:hypothetical protein